MIQFEFSDDVSDSGKLERAWQNLFQLKDARFFELPGRKALWQASQDRADKIRAAFDLTCVIGIGGSSLGGRALLRAFAKPSGHRVIFMEAPDETAARRWQEEIGPLHRVHFVIISKSGKTLETLALLDFWSGVFEKSKLKLAAQATVVCGPAKNPLLSWAEQNSVPVLDVPEDVGGRFSILTPVGLLPAALMGISLEDLRKGAAWALEQKRMTLELATACLQNFAKEKWITQLWVYSDAFYLLGMWWQQLWSESLGKKVLRDGGSAPRVSTPMVCMGPQDQHSLLQQVQEGTQDKSVILFRDQDAEKATSKFMSKNIKSLDASFSTMSLGEILKAEADGFRGALKPAGVPNFVMFGSSSRPESWGAFFMIWELTIGVLGEHFRINAFDQPGVELGKRLALDSLRQRL